MTTLYYHEEQSTNQVLAQEELQHTLFVLDQGWTTLIKACTEAGASIVLPNFQMSPNLLVQTIIREGKTTIATSQEIWNQIEDTVADYPQLGAQLQVCLFSN
ncbi:MAG: hypothetical protein ACFB15_23265 [Cyclobacteriaceae bacterium]